jgi:hypothetical protein
MGAWHYRRRLISIYTVSETISEVRLPLYLGVETVGCASSGITAACSLAFNMILAPLILDSQQQ